MSGDSKNGFSGVVKLDQAAEVGADGVSKMS